MRVSFLFFFYFPSWCWHLVSPTSMWAPNVRGNFLSEKSTVQQCGLIRVEWVQVAIERVLFLLHGPVRLQFRANLLLFDVLSHLNYGCQITDMDHAYMARPSPNSKATKTQHDGDVCQKLSLTCRRFLVTQLKCAFDPFFSLTKVGVPTLHLSSLF